MTYGNHWKNQKMQNGSEMITVDQRLDVSKHFTMWEHN